MRTNKPVTVTLGEMQERVDERVKSGSYASVSEVIRAGLRALDREDAALDAVIKQKVLEAMKDDRPGIPAEDVFSDLRAHHTQRMKAAKRGV